MTRGRKNIWLNEDVQHIISRYDQGESCKAIADSYGLSKNSIRDVLLENNIALNKGRSISAAKIGKPSGRLGCKASPETIAKMKLIDRSHYRRTTGRVYTEEQRQHMRDAWTIERKARIPRSDKPARPKRFFLTEEERVTRSRQRSRYKGLYRRLIEMTGAKKAYKTEEALGYSRDEFVSHIESQFLEGMSWEDRESFHIDHIVPVAHFFSQRIYDPKIVNALSNLQPLYPEVNRAKGCNMGFNQGVLT